MKPGEIYLVNFPYEDTNQVKTRPAVVLLADNENHTFMALKITKTQRSYDSFNIPIFDWPTSGLRYQSYIRCNKLQSFSTNDIFTTTKSNGYLGKLSNEDMQKMKETFSKYAYEVQQISHSMSAQEQDMQDLSYCSPEKIEFDTNIQISQDLLF